MAHDLMSKLTNKKITKPDNALFYGAKGEPFVRCYRGIQEGLLYLLGTGILFIKPVIFIPIQAIDSVVAGRGGSANTRYIDLKVETDSGTEYEFSNLDRDELVHIQVQLIN